MNTAASILKKEAVLCLNLVNLDISGVTEVPYKAEVSEDRKSLTLSLSDPAEEYSKLYGMEKNLEGTYQRISFTQEEPGYPSRLIWEFRMIWRLR